jgi:DNA mismatch repair protein MSH5
MRRLDPEVLIEVDDDDVDTPPSAVPRPVDVDDVGGAAIGASHCAVGLYSSSSSVGFAWIHPSRHIVECGEVLIKISSLAEGASPTASFNSGSQVSPLPALGSQFRWLQLSLDALQPRVVIAPNKGCPWLAAVLGALAVAPTLQPLGEFSAGKCREQMKFLWPQATALSWASRINIANEAMLMALSALLSHAIRAGLMVADIQEVTPQSVMQVDRSVLRALLVFREERHPAAAHGLGAAKEALSLYSLLSRVQSAAGRQTLRQWCSVPLCDAIATKARHDAVEFFVAHADLARQVLGCLRKCRHPGRLIRKIQTLCHGPREYRLLEQSCCAILELLEVVQTSPARNELLQLPAVCRLLDKIHPQPLQLIAQAIRRTVDFTPLEGAKTPGGGNIAGRRTVVILSGVDAQLDELRLYLGSMDSFLTAAAQRVVNALPPFYHSIPMSVVFFPSLGYLVVIDTRSSGAAFSLRSGDGLPTGWEVAFATEDSLYCKSDEMRELDQSIGDVHATIVERMAEIQRVLDAQLLSLAPNLLPMQDSGEVECLAAFAIAALEERWVRPAMCNAPVIELSNAFHPLLSRTSANHVVPFSFSVGLDTRVCIVSGANGSGKSVFVHTVPLIVFMAHIGCFVPCSSATIGIFEQLFLDTGGWAMAGFSSRGSHNFAPELASSFGSELCLVSRFIEQATQRSVVMLDEFGKGTLANDGIALLASIVDHFVSLGDQGPVVILTTHFTEIFSRRLVDISLVQRLHMKVVARVTRERQPSLLSAANTLFPEPVAAPADDTELCYLYQPEKSETVSVLSSQAFHCAIAASVPAAVAKRALVISRRLSLGASPLLTRDGAATTNKRSRSPSGSLPADLIAFFLQLPLADSGAVVELHHAIAAANEFAPGSTSSVVSG